MTIEQGGLYKIVLYENIGINIIKDAAGDIESIINSGITLEFIECENFVLTYIDKETSGANDKLVHEYTVSFSLFGFSTAYDQLEELASIFGFIPVLYFLDESIKVILSPLYKSKDVDYDESKTQIYTISLTSLVPTFESIRDFAAEEVVWVLENGIWGGSETIWTADGIWNTIPTDYYSTDVPGVDIPAGIVPTANETISL